MKHTQEVSIIIKDAMKTKHDLADLICWFDGFASGLKTNPDNNIDLTLPLNGIEIARKINFLLEKEIYNE